MPPFPSQIKVAVQLHMYLQHSSFYMCFLFASWNYCSFFPTLFKATVRPLLLPRITTVGSSTVPLVPLSSTARPLVPVTTSMNQVSSAPSQDFPPSTALTETSLMASSVQSSIAAVQTTVSNATVVSFASQRADSVAESEESDHMILTEQNVSNNQPLVINILYIF